MKKYINNFFNVVAKENNLNLNTKLSWGFYFSNKKRDNLLSAKRNLPKNRYSHTEIIHGENMYHLCVEEICVHDIDSLYNRCEELKTLAKDLRINSFDGFDVEKIN